jgi:glycosyltransferase involved in cell wall biosynthesis
MISNDPKMLGELTLSMLQGESGILHREFEKLRDWIRAERLPDIINLPNSLLISLAPMLRRELNRPVVCTLQGEELFIEGLAEPYRSRALERIRSQVQQVDHFIPVSEYCAEFMTNYLSVPRDKASTVPLGINIQGYEQRLRPAEGEFRIGYFARIAPEKGLHLLADAYIRFRRLIGDSRAKLEIAGYVSPVHAGYLENVKQTLKRAGLENEFAYRGVVDREGKLAFLRGLDLLSVPATYDEPKGMFLLEAMACGVPVVQPRRGAFVEIVENTGGGLLVTPDNSDALAQAFRKLYEDRSARETLGSKGFENVRKHYSIQVSATRLLDVYKSVSGAA